MTRRVGHLLLGVCGSSAATGVDRLLAEAARYADRTTIVATEAAATLFLPSGLSAPVLTDTDWHTSPDPLHVQLLQDTDCFVVAPATANTIARVAAGLADTLLTTLVLAHGPGVYFQPSMNARMWTNPMTRKNITTLQAAGHHVLPATPTATMTSNTAEGIGPIPGTVLPNVFGDHAPY